jgi:hypothetical protein
MPAASTHAKNSVYRPVIGPPCVLVADGGGEEFEEAADGRVAGAGDRRRHDETASRF